MIFQCTNICALVSVMLLIISLREHATVLAYPHNLQTEEMIEPGSISESFENELEKIQLNDRLNKVIDTLTLLDMPRPHLLGESYAEYMEKPLPSMSKKKNPVYCGLKVCKFTG